MPERTILMLLMLPVAGCGRSGQDGAADKGAAAAPAVAPVARGGGREFVGAGSCSASSCHGGTGPAGAWLSEHTTWIAHDPHARAYEILWDTRSVTIAKHLGLGAAHQETLCLNCHVQPNYHEAAHTPRFRKEDGVGCESCHGPAGRWLHAHYQDGWRLKTLKEKSELGMMDTKSLPARAAICVRCHVGGPGADVNHDLIAAGHPPLRFEFAAFHANLPRHWDDKKDLTPSKKAPAIDPRGWPDFDARAWAIGQAVSAQAALELLAHRARRDHSWPEFAAFDCFACHHALKSPSWRQHAASGRGLGSLAWNEWYFAMLDPLLKGLAIDEPELAASLVQIKRTMESRLLAGAHLEKTATRAAGLVQAVMPRLAKRLDRIDAKELARTLLPPDDPLSAWDRAAQCSLGLDALRQAAAASQAWKADARLDGILARLRRQLRAPEEFNPALVRQTFQELRPLLER